MPTDSQTILVVGGAGFIGSHMVLALREANYQVVVLDSLRNGHPHAALDAELVVGEMSNMNLLKQLFSAYHFTAVMHFASLINVAESLLEPYQYYKNNVADLLPLLEIMHKHAVQKLVFSSSAAVYGEPKTSLIKESHPLAPINPYGRSKWMAEEIIKDFAVSHGLQYAILRYFNAAGADPKGRLYECHTPETHLIPLLLQTAAGVREVVTIYGNDYPTQDGSAIRDYVHVSDLCAAHLLALQALDKRQENIICNLGTGAGYSVQQVVEVVKRVTKRSLNILEGARRLGDPAVLVADATYAREVLAWQPIYSEIEVIVKHAWNAMELILA